MGCCNGKIEEFSNISGCRLEDLVVELRNLDTTIFCYMKTKVQKLHRKAKDPMLNLRKFQKWTSVVLV